MKTCKVPSCDNKHHGKGYCKQHYYEFVLTPRCNNIICSVNGCNKHISPKYTKLKLCVMHGTRLTRNGSVELRQRERDIASFIDILVNSENPLDFEIANNNSFSEICKMYYGNKCMECGWDIGSCEVHHRIPKSKGGKSTIRNALVLCPNCHSLKHIPRKKRFSDKKKQELINKLKNIHNVT